MHREKRLTLLMVTGAVAPLLLFASFAVLSHGRVLRDAEAVGRARVTVIREHVTQVIGFEEKILRLADSLLEAQGDQRSYAFLTDLTGTEPSHFSIAVADRAGHIIALGGVPDPGNVRIGDRAYFQTVMATRDLVVGRPVLDRLSGRRIIPLAVRRDDGSGAVVAGVPEAYLEAVFADAAGRDRDDAATVSLIRSDGSHLARYPPLSLSPTRLPPDAWGLRQVGQVSSGAVHTFRDEEGDRRWILSYARVGGYPLYVGYAIGLSHALAPWWTGLATGGGLAVLSALVLSGLAHGARRQARQARRTEARLTAEVAARTVEAERRAAEAEQAGLDARRALVAVERADRAKVHFLASISHDLRQPLQALRLYMDLTERRGAEVACQALGAQAEQALERMERLLRTTLDMAILDTGALDAQMRPVSLGPLLGELRSDFAAEADKKGLDLVILPTTVVVNSDPVLLRRILTNLLSNAIRYTMQGRVLVGIRRGGGVRVVIADTGVGFSEEDRGHLFDGSMAMRAAEPGRQGLGVGLSVVGRIAALLGHGISVGSRPGRGSVFAVHLDPPRGETAAHGVASAGEPVTLSPDRSPVPGLP